MYCRKCGTLNQEDIGQCVNCGETLSPAYQSQSPTPRPPDYLVLSIVSTVLCCLIPGIVAIVYAAQVSAKWALGDYAAAVDASNKAKTWSLVSIGLGIIYVGIAVAAALSGALD